MWHKEGRFDIKSSWDDHDKPSSLNSLDKDSKKVPSLNDRLPKKESDKKSMDVLDVLDNEIAKRIYKDFKAEGGFQSL